MKWKLYTLLFTGISVLTISCKTASKMYEKGYDEAVELAAKKLQKDPDDPKLLNIIQSSYRYAVNDHESRISDYAQSNNERNGNGCTMNMFPCKDCMMPFTKYLPYLTWLSP